MPPARRSSLLLFLAFGLACACRDSLLLLILYVRVASRARVLRAAWVTPRALLTPHADLFRVPASFPVSSFRFCF